MSTEFDPAPAEKILSDHSAELGPDAATYLAQAKARLGGSRTPEDHREAAKLAAETAKTILTVDIAGLVAVGTFLQFARNGGVAWSSATIGLFGLAAVLGTVAMATGFSVISGIYKRADGREHGNLPAWSTDTAVEPLNRLVMLSAGALACLVAGLVVWAGEDQRSEGIDCELTAPNDGQGETGRAVAHSKNGRSVVIRSSPDGVEAVCSP